jgi:DNA gyrase/topoisomerase IV subunit A
MTTGAKLGKDLPNLRSPFVAIRPLRASKRASYFADRGSFLNDEGVPVLLTPSEIISHAGHAQRPSALRTKAYELGRCDGRFHSPKRQADFVFVLDKCIEAARKTDKETSSSDPQCADRFPDGFRIKPMKQLSYTVAECFCWTLRRAVPALRVEIEAMECADESKCQHYFSWGIYECK